jgi:exodeoxyribonuclease V gamma subunit
MAESASLAAPVEPGLAVIHSNRLENLRLLLVEWLRRYPLAPLENEAVLVQSNGMAQWLKLALADSGGLGVCAAVDAQLPARFLWEAYRAVLGDDAVPEVSPFDRETLGWRLFRMLPELLDRPAFAPLERFLAGDADGRKRHQLAEGLAGPFDQYQVYRADWLEDWAAGRGQLRDARGAALPLPEDQAWQAELWRALVDDLPPERRDASRARLHERFLAELEAASERPEGLPRRVVVFGLSSLPHQTLRALAALGRFCQVLLCVHNPCRHYWADIIEHRELLRAERRRHARKAAMPADLAPEDLHLHANPLLAAWGKQGRDYIRLLDEWDDPALYRDRFESIDLFEDVGEVGRRSLLEKLQQSILDLEPLPAEPALRARAVADGSMAFHVAHSPQREVEILQDRLLDLFASAEAAGRPLAPRDVIVMVPDIDAYAPHVRAVFGQIERDDPRHIPFTLADQRERGRNPLLVAVESLLRLPESRWAVGELLDLLDVPAVRARFGLSEADLPLLHRWVEGAGIRWGLDGEQRAALDLPDGLEQNAWRFGLRRMLLGYAVGTGEAFAGIEPYEEIGGLDAVLVGSLAALLDALGKHGRELARPAAPGEWGERLRALLDGFFLAEDDADVLTLEKLLGCLERWQDLCAEARLEEPLPLCVVREAWLAAVDQPSLSQRFLAGRVNFCTLLPMRAIPFEAVCLLGMNDGDFPRGRPPQGFDLMAGPAGYRPGDRSRRDDDRYLFLEALLSARRHLHVSWVGRRAQDNATEPPSLLVAQLRDYLAAGWQVADAEPGADPGRVLLDRLTVEHPLQPFSPRYFLPAGAEEHDPRLVSYAREWRAAHEAGEAAADAALAPFEPPPSLGLQTLSGFLRHPVRAFFAERLQVRFDADESAALDAEPFACDGLQNYLFGSELLASALAGPPESARERFEAMAARQRRRGDLPLGGFADLVQAGFADPAWQAYLRAERLLAAWPEAAERPAEIRLDLALPGGTALTVEDWLPNLRGDGRGRWAQIELRPAAVAAKDGTAKWHSLVAPWVRHLAGCAAGLNLTTFQAGADRCWLLPPIPAIQAGEWLAVALAAWLQGMRGPLPLPCKTAFAWLSEISDPDKAWARAKAEYEGGYQRTGEVQQDACLARAYPRFDPLFEGERNLDYWGRRVYQPLLETLDSPPEGEA